MAFALQPASRAWRPEAGGERPRGGSLRTPAMRTLVTVLVGVGVLFGARRGRGRRGADALGSSAAAGPLLALWGAGSLLGGLLAVRLGGGARASGSCCAALAAGHLALVPAAGNVIALGAVLLVAGAAIAPTYATVYAMVDARRPRGHRDRGVRVARDRDRDRRRDRRGRRRRASPSTRVRRAAFALAGAAGAIALLAALLRSPTLPATGPAAVAVAAA